MIVLKSKWSELLKKNITVYAKGRPKRGMFIEDYLKLQDILPDSSTCLEQGAFSAKDSLYLKGVFPKWHFTATDRELDVVEHICDVGLDGLQEDAFKLSFKDDKFDLTFQSGLIVLFNDQQALQIIKEQLRVTSKISFIFAHNRHNYIDQIIALLKRKILKKSIYTYRSYTEGDLKAIALSLGFRYELFYYDNMVLNFVSRHCPWFSPIVLKLGIDKYRCLANELVLVLRK